jgi:hypothetical protein
MLLKFARQGIENFPVVSTRGTFMFEDLNNKLLHIRVANNLILKIRCTYLCHQCFLLLFLCLVKMIQFVIQKHINQLLKLCRHVSWENHLRGFEHVGPGFKRVLLLHLQWVIRILLFFQSQVFLRVEYHNKRHHVGVLLQMKVFLCNPLIVSEVTVKHLLLWLKYLCEVLNHSAHIDVRQVNKNNWAIRLHLLLDHSSELVHVRVHCELNVKSSFENLGEVMVSHFICDELVDYYFVVGGKFITENAFDGL